MSEQEFTISELVARTDVPRATVHHYLREGLLPPPRRVARNRFLYSEDHVRALQLVRLLRERRDLSLDAIREVLPDLLGRTDDEAFRPDMWDDAFSRYLRESAKRSPSARILDAAIELFAAHGYGETNVDEISRAAGVAKGSVYRHYATKEDLFFHAVEEGMVRALASVELPPGGDTDAAADALAAAVAPRASLVLDLLAGALQRRPGYRAVVTRVAARLGAQLAELTGNRFAVGPLAEAAAARIMVGLLEPDGPKDLRRLLGA